MRKKGNSAAGSTLVILLLLTAVFLLSKNTGAQPLAVFTNGGGVIYAGREGAALMCAVRYDADIAGLLEAAGKDAVPVTFFVTPAWAKANGALIQKMQTQGCECGLLGRAETSGGLDAELAAAEEYGVFSKFYMPENDASARRVSAFAAKRGYKTVLCSFDVKRVSSEPADIAGLVREKWHQGAMIRFVPAQTVLEAFPMMASALRVEGARLVTLSRLLGSGGT